MHSGNPLYHIGNLAWSMAVRQRRPQYTLAAMPPRLAGPLLADYYRAAPPNGGQYVWVAPGCGIPASNLRRATTPAQATAHAARGALLELDPANEGATLAAAAAVPVGAQVEVVYPPHGAAYAAAVAAAVHHAGGYAHCIAVGGGEVKAAPEGGWGAVVRHGSGIVTLPTAPGVYYTQGRNAVGHTTPWLPTPRPYPPPATRAAGVTAPTLRGGTYWPLQVHELAALPHGTALTDPEGQVWRWDAYTQEGGLLPEVYTAVHQPVGGVPCLPLGITEAVYQEVWASTGGVSGARPAPGGGTR